MASIPKGLKVGDEIRFTFAEQDDPDIPFGGKVVEIGNGIIKAAAGGGIWTLHPGEGVTIKKKHRRG
jgi:hypothetical protein